MISLEMHVYYWTTKSSNTGADGLGVACNDVLCQRSSISRSSSSSSSSSSGGGIVMSAY